MNFFSDYIIKINVPYHINNDTKPYYTLSNNRDAPDSMAIDKFFRLLAVCHSVVPGNLLPFLLKLNFLFLTFLINWKRF